MTGIVPPRDFFSAVLGSKHVNYEKKFFKEYEVIVVVLVLLGGSGVRSYLPPDPKLHFIRPLLKSTVHRILAFFDRLDEVHFESSGENSSIALRTVIICVTTCVTWCCAT